MYGYLYILQTKGNHYYVGNTNNLRRRLFEHKIGCTKSLRKLLPIKLVFAEKYDSITQARKIKAKLKKLKSRKIIEKIIRNGRINVRV